MVMTVDQQLMVQQQRWNPSGLAFKESLSPPKVANANTVPTVKNVQTIHVTIPIGI
jgi:hypothetical protein